MRSIWRSTALCAVQTCVLCGRPPAVQNHNMSSGRSTRQSIAPAVFNQLLWAVNRPFDHYTLNLQVYVLHMAGRPAHCLELHLVFYLTPLNSDIWAIFSDELENSNNKILHSFPTHAYPIFCSFQTFLRTFSSF